MTLEKWSTLSSRVVHADRWINLRADRVVTAGGAVLDPYYVLDYPDWAHVVAITPDDRLVMVRQYRHGVGAIGLELPGGGVDPADPDIRAAAERELLEETGYVGGAVTHVASLSTNPATHTNHVHFFLATQAVPATAPDPGFGEELAVELVPVATVLDGLSTGLVSQAMHVAGLFLALRQYGR
jgi:8-oxo-dGTP pyrophosphatase MutT (NUDIX family)